MHHVGQHNHHMRNFKADLMQIRDNGTRRSHMQNLTRTGCFRVQRGVDNIYLNIVFFSLSAFSCSLFLVTCTIHTPILTRNLILRIYIYIHDP